MKKVILVISFLLVGVSSFSQKSQLKEIDSLKVQLHKTTADTTKIDLLHRLSISYYYIDSKKSLEYAKSIYSLSKKIHYTKGLALSYNNFAVYYKLKSDFPKALKYNYKSLHIYESLNDKRGIAKTNNGLGTIYVEFKNYKLALACYKKAIKSSQEINDKKSIATYLNNIGDVYLRAKEYSKALYYFDKAIKMNVFEKNSYEAGLNYTNIGITLNRLKAYKKAIEFCNKSILIYNDDSSFFNAYNKLELGISHYYLAIAEQNKIKRNQLLQQSLQYTNQALKIFKREESLIDIRDTYSYLSKIYKAQEKSEQALTFFEKSSNINDSIFSNENKIQIEFLKSQREIELRNKKIEIQNLKIKSDSTKVYLLYTIILAVIILLSLFLWLYLSKRKTNLKLKEKNNIISKINKQKDKFFSIIAHDLRGPFNGFLGLTELLAEDIDDMNKDEIQFAAVNMRNSAKNLNQLLENLLEWSRMEQGLIPFSPQKMNLIEVVGQCTTTLQDAANKKSILIKTNIDNNITIFADYHILQSVIRNILSNALKFTPKNGTIKIEAQEDPKNTTISIADSGVGINTKMVKKIFQLDAKKNRIGTDGEPSTGLGLILCKEFVTKHGGKIWVESEENKGSTFYFSFPHAIT